ncbi:MAG: hypothetical protein Q9187_007759 [Circinaria calcarea]
MERDSNNFVRVGVVEVDPNVDGVMMDVDLNDVPEEKDEDSSPTSPSLALRRWGWDWGSRPARTAEEPEDDDMEIGAAYVLLRKPLAHRSSQEGFLLDQALKAVGKKLTGKVRNHLGSNRYIKDTGVFAHSLPSPSGLPVSQTGLEGEYCASQRTCLLHLRPMVPEAAPARPYRARTGASSVAALARPGILPPRIIYFAAADRASRRR